MINNRQGGRRRGRGGQRPQNLGGQPGGNRQDNRQRGNAAQLLEKYKSMARDSQLAGDRVQTEYYLQFADHYYRILGESRARFEEQRRQRGDDSDDDEMDEQLDADGDQGEADGDRNERFERQERRPQRERNDRNDRSERGRRYGRDERGSDEQQGERSTNGAQRPNEPEERIPFEALPPAIGVSSDDDVETAEIIEAKPRRRTRRPRADDGDGEIAPAA